MNKYLAAFLLSLCLAILGLGIVGLAEGYIWEKYGGEGFVTATKAMTEIPSYLKGKDADKAALEAAKAILSHTQSYRERVDTGMSKHETESLSDPRARLEFWRSQHPSVAERYESLIDFEQQLKLSVDNNAVSQATLKGIGLQLQSLEHFNELELSRPALYAVCNFCKWCVIVVLVILGWLLWIFAMSAR